MIIHVEDIASRLAVDDAVVRMFVATDERDWPTLETCFTDPFTLDMTSMACGSLSAMTPRQVADASAEGWRLWITFTIRWAIFEPS